MKIPQKGWVVVCEKCDSIPYRPHELFYEDLDWCCQDAKDLNKDHKGHKVVEVVVIKAR